MIGIDKPGYVKELRSLLYLGARSYIGRMSDIPKTQKDAWLDKAIKRIGFKTICITLANEIVRTAWPCCTITQNKNQFLFLNESSVDLNFTK